ncbi:hypothetical protein OH146_11245 [Salinibacterium sp. SYSU T00001]|uniref:hypothetical protein n=1 Tax=Homoserinimonas sedimenticola TaxID=2986805 RepID=UPI0022357EE9|nr:hypothetical protein [Salinibacterium sedimenticola]MCW4386348.1 hypothetical protein [Salinibacterium sedimenticola]
MKRIDYYGRSFTVSDRYAEAFIGYVNHLVESGRPFGEFFTVRCYTNDPEMLVDVSIQLVAGVPVLVYPAGPEYVDAVEPYDDASVIEHLNRRD